MYDYAMTLKARYNFMIHEAQRDGLRAIKERDGISESEQIRRAIDAWLANKGVRKADRTRARTRKRP
jgi:hypothetical protein